MPKKKKAKKECPCGSGANYRDCCQRFHEGAEPGSATELMRSRFSAFAKGDFPYLWRTLHPDHVDRTEERDTWIENAKKTSGPLNFRRLRILDAEAGEATARVLFHVVVSRHRRDASFAELSRFAHDGEGWRYLDGTLLPNRALPKPFDDLSIPAFEALAKRVLAS
ncbi:MAG: YchJ family metal-binding protein [Myxococcota bacterium]